MDFDNSTDTITPDNSSVFTIGGDLAIAGVLIGSTATGLTATGTDQSGALAITASLNVVETTASGTGVRLPTPSQIGATITIVNRGANSLLVYPAVGHSIDNGATNASVSVPANKTIILQFSNTTLWYIITAPASTSAPGSFIGGSGSASIVFPAFPGSNEASVVVTGISAIVAGSIVNAFIMSDDTSVSYTANDHKYLADFISLSCGSISAGTGFTIHARSTQLLSGTITVRYSWMAP